MDIQKASWTNTTDGVNLSFEFTKVDKEKRIVSGFATLDNVDRHGDIVTTEASEKAFQQFAGNLREMHQPIAIGKVVNFTPKEYIDKDGASYKGVYVDAYISKGSQDAWEKVLDKTYTGFSIGGNIVSTETQKSGDKPVRVIKDYELMELSLVDTPANPLASIISIKKNEDGLFAKGLGTVEIENVFWCTTDNLATTTKSESEDCAICGNAMINTGWVEKNDLKKSESIVSTVAAYFTKDDAPGPTHGAIDSTDTTNLYPDQNKATNDSVANFFYDKMEKVTDSNSKGGNEMADETEVVEEATPVDEVVEETVEEAVPATDDDESVEKALSVSEVPVEELDFVKMVDGFKNDVTKKITKSNSKMEKEIAGIYKEFQALSTEFSKSVTDYGTNTTQLVGNVADVVKAIEGFNKTLDDVVKRIEALESSTAIKKSGDAVASTDESTKITKDIWGGHFLGVQDLV